MVFEIKGIKKQFVNENGKKTAVLDTIDFSAKKGEIITIFGPNGCGKTTLMNIIAGIEAPSCGNVVFSKNGSKNGSASIGYVFQDFRPSLLPWKKVLQNIGAPLLWRGMEKGEVLAKVKNKMHELNISIDLDAYPHALSGGQAQLACILRSLMTEPELLILDEPLSALDYFNRINLMLELQKIFAYVKTTALFISHDIDEAIFLGDRLLILSARPAKIIESIEIPIPRPRDKNIFTQDIFVKIKEKALSSAFMHNLKPQTPCP